MKDYMEEIVESVVATVETVEFLHGVPVKLPSQYKADLRGAIRKALTTIDKKAREHCIQEIKDTRDEHNDARHGTEPEDAYDRAIWALERPDHLWEEPQFHCVECGVPIEQKQAQCSDCRVS